MVYLNALTVNQQFHTQPYPNKKLVKKAFNLIYPVLKTTKPNKSIITGSIIFVIFKDEIFNIGIPPNVQFIICMRV